MPERQCYQLKRHVHYPAGPQEPQPAPQDLDKLQPQQGGVAAAAVPSAVPKQPASSAESPRPSQPPADNESLDAHPHSSRLKQGEAQRSKQHKAEQVPSGLASSHMGEEDVGAREQALQLLREHVARVTEAAACLQALDSNEAECNKVRPCSTQQLSLCLAYAMMVHQPSASGQVCLHQNSLLKP